MTFDFADIFKLVLWVFFGALALALFMAIGLGKTAKARLGGALMVLGLFGLVAALAYYKVIAEPRQFAAEEARRKGIPTADEYKKRYVKAKELFDARCKMAGEEITRKIHNVDGVVWMKWRPAGLNREQFALDDPYGKDCTMEGCILRLLRGNEVRAADQEPGAKPKLGYRFVETIDPRDGVRYRYTGVFKSITDVPKEQFSEHVRSTGSGAELDGRFLALQREPINSFSARFGITWDDVSTRDDRESWIAGGAVKVIDLQTQETIAERLGYLIDTGQGSTKGYRDPWGWAKSYSPRCPVRYESTWDFAMRALQPTRKGE